MVAVSIETAAPCQAGEHGKDILVIRSSSWGQTSYTRSSLCAQAEPLLLAVHQSISYVSLKYLHPAFYLLVAAFSRPL
jgi:hypothetical protein